MTVISDTNILSSFAAADALLLLQRLFVRSGMSVPPAVRDEIQVAMDRGRRYLEPVVAAIRNETIPVLVLNEQEYQVVATLPHKLNAGEREAIALCQVRRFLLLTNDRRALRYCQTARIDALDLATILRLLWTRQIAARNEVEQRIQQMERVERLTLTAEQRAAIFAQPRRRR